MYFDRVVTDLIGFINRLLWWRAKKVKQRPYDPVGRQIRGDLGILQRIRRYPLDGQPDRYTDYFIFMPFPQFLKPGQEWMDVHITCSRLGALDVEAPLFKRGRRDSEPTHQIDIILASHSVSPSGIWDGDQLHTSTVDLIGTRSPTPQDMPPSILTDMPWLRIYRDGFAVQITEKLARELLHKPLHEINWAVEQEILRKIVMKGAFIPDPNAPAVAKNTKKIKSVNSVNNKIQLE
ncbi:MAG TPA: hypothetical protein V6C65_04225 [Allocoleopsis sp.]